MPMKRTRPCSLSFTRAGRVSFTTCTRQAGVSALNQLLKSTKGPERTQSDTCSSGRQAVVASWWWLQSERANTSTSKHVNCKRAMMLTNTSIEHRQP